MHTITKNVFGLENDSLLHAAMVEAVVMSYLISFAKTFGTPETWPTTRHFIEEAGRIVRSEPMNS